MNNNNENKESYMKSEQDRASYVKVPPEEPGWRMVTLETAPFAERIQIPRAPL